MKEKIKFKSVKKLTNHNFTELEVVIEKFNSITGKVDDFRMSVPIDPDKFDDDGNRIYQGNIHYAEIKRQVDAGELTIEEAD